MRKNVVIPAVAATVALSVTLMSLAACGSSSSSSSTPVTPANTPFDITKINHVVVIYQENWSFDAQYGQFPGANGLAIGTPVVQTKATASAVGTTGGTGTPGTGGVPLTAIPSPLNSSNGLDTTNFPNWSATVPMATFNLFGGNGDLVSDTTITGDIVHRFYIEQWQADGGKQDQNLAWSDNPGLVLSQFDATNLPIGKLAQKYTLCDAFFHSAWGGSYLNHQYLISAQAPSFGAPPVAAVPVSALTGYPAFVQTSTVVGTVVTPVTLGTPGVTIPQATLLTGPYSIATTGTDWPAALNPVGTAPYQQDGQLLAAADVTNPALGNGVQYGINTMYPVNWPFPTTVSNGVVIPSGKFTPAQTHSTIGDLLSNAGQSWAWFSEGWNDAVAGNPDPLFQYHHQAFNYYKQYAPGSVGRVHLQDYSDLVNDIATNTLPAVSFVKLLGPNNEHPGYADILNGQQKVADLVAKIQNSPAWGSTAIFITYDEHGGRYDHVNPLTYPTRDAWGPGERVPCIVISPYAKAGFVDHTNMETVSILSFIEKRWNLGTIPGATRDATAIPFTNSFQGVPMANN